MKLQRLVVLLMISLIPPTALFAESSVWTVSSGESRVFLGGTIHILSQNDFPPPGEFERAYAQSGTIVFETDISEINSPETQLRLIEEFSYQDGTTLDAVLSEETYQKTEDYFLRLGIPMEGLISFRPGFIAITITAIELQKLGFNSEGIDYYYFGRAVSDGKDLGRLETVDEQIDFVVHMGEGIEDELIESTFRDTEQLPELMKSMMEAWRKGDLTVLEEVFVTSLDEEFPDIYRELIAERNNAWVPQIESMFDTEETEFVLVGTAHLVGPDGLLAQLSRRGYTVEYTR